MKNSKVNLEGMGTKPLLCKELTFIVQQTPDIERLHASFEELIEVCNKAIEKNEQVYCFCD